MTSLSLDPDRALPFPAEQRSVAREIYAETKDLPLICMHGHVEPEVFADDSPFADPAQLLIVPDHYVFRMLASQGIEPARLGVPRLDGGPVETDSRKIWRTFCENWKLFRGTPSRYWLEHELVEVFGVDLVPSAETADAIYDQIADCVADPGFRPRALLDRFNIEVISTTDAATSDLQQHARLAADGLGERVLPTFRPDAVAYLDRPSLARRRRRAGEGLRGRHGDLRRLPRRTACAACGLRRSRRPRHRPRPSAGRHHPDGARARPGALYARVLGGAEASPAEVDAVRREHAVRDGRDVVRGRPGDADPPRRAAQPQHGDLRGVRAGQGLRHPDPDRVHPSPATDAGPVRHRSPVPGDPLHRRRDRLQPGAGPDRRHLSRRFGWARPGGSWTRRRACAGSARPRPRPAASTTPPASWTTRGRSPPSLPGTTCSAGSMRATSPGWCWNTGSAWTRPIETAVDLAYNLPKESYARG